MRTLSPTIGLDLRYHMISWGEGRGFSLRDFQEIRWVPHDHIFSVAPCRLICFRGTPPHQTSTNHRLAVGNSALRFPRQVAVCHQSLGTTLYTNGMERPCPWPKLYSTRKTLSSGPWPVALGTPHMQGLNMRIRWRIITSELWSMHVRVYRWQLLIKQNPSSQNIENELRTVLTHPTNNKHKIIEYGVIHSHSPQNTYTNTATHHVITRLPKTEAVRETRESTFGFCWHCYQNYSKL